jgi:hypothetical protein
VWDSHPLSVGATPLQVYVDGRPTLDQEKVKESMSMVSDGVPAASSRSRVRPMLKDSDRETACRSMFDSKGKITFTGLAASYLPGFSAADSDNSSLTAIVDQGRLICVGTASECVSDASGTTVVQLKNGYISPGITSVARALGLVEIAGESSTQDGSGTRAANPSNPEQIAYAKYGIHLDGKAFNRAIFGGVTRSVTIPLFDGGIGEGVSVGIRTGANYTILDGGIFKDDVAMHMNIGQSSKGMLLRGFIHLLTNLSLLASSSTPSISLAIAKLRQILTESHGKANIYRTIANGSLPLVVEADNKVRIVISV